MNLYDTCEFSPKARFMIIFNELKRPLLDSRALLRKSFGPILLGLAFLVLGCSDPSGRIAPGGSPEGNEVERFRAAVEEPDFLLGALQASDALTRATAADLDGLLRVFAERDPVPRYHDRALFAIWWARFDPESAYEWSTDFRNGVDTGIRTEIVRLWARADPSAAARQVKTMPGRQSERLEFWSAVAVGWYESRQPGIEAFLESAQGSLEQNAVVEVIELIQASEGSEAAIEWVEQLAVGPRTRLTAFRRAAVLLGQNDPEAAKRFVETHMDGPQRSNLIRLAAGRLAGHDGLSTMAWLRTLPPGGERNFGVEDAFRRWNRNAPEEATAWLESQPMAAWLEPAHVVYAGLVGRDDPKAGIARARRITTEELKHKAMVYIVHAWRVRDDDAARMWVGEQTNLPTDIVEEMLAPLGGSGRPRPRRPS